MKYFIYLVFAALVVNTASAQVIPVLKPVGKKIQKAVTIPQQKTVRKKNTDGYVENYRWNYGGYTEFYTGYIRHGVPDGKGATYSDDKVIKFEGVFENGEYSNGIWYLNGKKIYEGNFTTGRYMAGYGKQYDSEGKLWYEGNFINGNFNGLGKLYYSDGEVYEGNFGELGKRQGSGVLKNSLKGYECIGVFDQYFLEGEIHFSDGSKYVGKMSAFNNSTNTGNKGVYYFANGDTYEGEFFNKMMHGKGKYTWKNGSRYTGVFQSNQINGHGELYGGFKKDGVLVPPYVGTFKTLPDGKINFDENGTKRHMTISQPNGPPFPLQLPNDSCK